MMGCILIKLQRGLKGLIRKLYTFGSLERKHERVVVTLPRLVLMETLSYLPHWLPFYQDYQEFYRIIARYYNIPVWSIRDAANSNYSSTHQHQSSYVKVMQHYESVRYDLHPGWHVHLFYADFVAALLNYSTSDHRCSLYISRNTKNPQINPVELLKPMFDDVNTTCDPSVKPILHISAEMVQNNNITAIVGKWSRQHAGSWDLRSEGRGRWRWIQEKTNGLSDPAHLTFFPDDPKRALGESGQNPQIISIEYLRTYKNAGQVRLIFCGNLMQGGDGMVRGNLDALWQSYEAYKLSLPEIQYVVFPDFGFRCKNKSDMGNPL